MNCSLMLEEAIHEQRDKRKPLYIAFLNAKSSFDVVNHDSLLRKLYHSGIDGATWLLIQSLHDGGTTAVKWKGAVSYIFHIKQRVREGGGVSIDLYKVYQDGSINRIAVVEGGYHISEICWAVPTCADDSAPMSGELPPIQSKVSTAEDYYLGLCIMEEFLIQPDKSVELLVPYKAA